MESWVCGSTSLYFCWEFWSSPVLGLTGGASGLGAADDVLILSKTALICVLEFFCLLGYLNQSPFFGELTQRIYVNLFFFHASYLIETQETWSKFAFLIIKSLKLEAGDD